MKRRSLDGLLLVDKPAGMTSMRAVAIVKCLLSCEKAGHTGTLDPLATGLLPICLGRATRLAQYLLASEKRYAARLRFGVTTDTEDSDGRIVSEKPLPEGFSEAQLEEVLGGFRGAIWQTPPKVSALHVDGKRAYDLARQGQDFELKARPVEVFELRLTAFEPPEASLLCHVSKGTYIRSLIRDIGATLGCGATMTGLRRLSSGTLALENALTLQEIQDAPDAAISALLPLASMLSHLPTLEPSEAALHRLAQGLISYELQALPPLSQAIHRVLSPDGSLLALLQPSDEGRWTIVSVFG